MESPLTAHENADADEAARPLGARERRFLTWGIALFVVGGYLVFQLFAVWTVKDAVPPSWAVGFFISFSVNRPCLARKPPARPQRKNSGIVDARGSVP